MSTEFTALVIKDILGVIYAPHKTFKRIAENPKYLGVAIIIVLFVALQTTYYYNYYSKINYEQTVPPAGELSAFTTANATQWATTQGTTVTQNTADFINQTYYGNNSLQFAITNSNNLTATLEQFGYTANCGSGGFTNLSMNIKQVTPNIAPQSAILTLYTANGTSSYFTLDITSMLTGNLGEWNNLTIPVGTSEWQSTNSPDWSQVTGLKLDLTYPAASNITILLQGVFFRGLYQTQIEALSVGTFLGFAAYSVVIQALFQWIILAAVAYLILKGLKATNIVWRPLFIVIGFTLVALVITALIALLGSLALPTVYYPYDYPPYASLIYPESYVSGTSIASQATYQSIVAATATYTTISTAITVIMYVWQVVLVTFAVKAVSGFSYAKSIATAVGAVILTVLILSLLSAIGLI
ncbi:MAG: hypothetical protein ACFCUE_00820 [Candidatus Bathyarchaeia archaeon]